MNCEDFAKAWSELTTLRAELEKATDEHKRVDQERGAFAREMATAIADLRAENAVLRAKPLFSRRQLIADNDALRAERDRLLERVRAVAEAGCVRTWGAHPMKCFPKDKCSFCRCRELLDEIGKSASPDIRKDELERLSARVTDLETLVSLLETCTACEASLCGPEVDGEYGAPHCRDHYPDDDQASAWLDKINAVRERLTRRPTP